MSLRKKKLISAAILSIIVLSGVIVFSNNVLAQSGFENELSPGTPGGEILNPATDPTKNFAATSESAGTESSIGNVLAWILFYMATGASYIVAIFIRAMVYIASYNHFLDQHVVINGWNIVRDIANNFFIIILLVIAMGTILRVPNYNRQLLPKLLVMAALINFSKMFTGILIDFSQIITLWFAAAINTKGTEGNILLFALGLDQLYKMDFSSVSNIGWTEDVPGLTPGTAIRTLFFALILSVVALVVIAMITVVLVYRIVMLWFLVILSPLAFLLTTFPKGQQYAGQWWGELSKYLVVGPVMLFFLYLSFFSGSVRGDSPSALTTSQATGIRVPNLTDPITAEKAPANLGLSKFENDPVELIDFLIIIGLMVGSLVMGQKVGTKGGDWAGKGVASLQKLGKKATIGAATGAAGFVGARTLTGAAKVPYLGGFIARTPFLGKAADRQAVKLSTAKYKTEQERIANRGQALKVDSMDETQLRNLEKGGDKYARIAATRAMMQKGMFQDDDKANRDDNIRMINYARKALPPELATAFNDNTKKYNPGLAHETVYKDESGQFRTDAFVSDVKTGKVKAHEMIAALDKNQIAELVVAISASPALKAAGQENLGKFLLHNVSEKDLGEMNGELIKEARDEVWQGISHTSWERKENAAGEQEITDNGKKMRDKFIKAGNFNNIMDAFDDKNSSDVESIRNFVSNNSSDIGKKMKEVSEQFVESFGDLIDPNQFKDQAPAIKERLQKSFDTVINKMSEADIDLTDPIKKKTKQRLIKNALMSGATFKESAIDEGADLTDRTKFANDKKRTILKDIMSTSSVKDIERMKNINVSTTQTKVAAKYLDAGVIKGLSVSPEGSLLVREILDEVKDQSTGLPSTDPMAKKADKLKDI